MSRSSDILLPVIICASLLVSAVSVAAAPGAGQKTDIRALLEKSKKEADPKKRRALLRELSNAAPSTPAELRLLWDAARTSDKDAREATLDSLRHIPPPSEFTPELKDAYADLIGESDEAIEIVGFDACSASRHGGCARKIHERIAKRKKITIRGKNLGGVSADDIRYMQKAVAALGDLGYVDALDDVIARDEIMRLDGVGGPLVAKFGAAALPKVIPLAKGSDERSATARSVIANMRDDRAVDKLIEVLTDSDAQLVAASAAALAKMPTNSAAIRSQIEGALEKLREHPDPYSRANAHAGLVRLNSTRHMNDTMKALREDPGVRLQILYSLMQHNVKEAVPHLKTFIEQDGEKNPNKPYARRVAAQAIYKLTGEKFPYKGAETDLERFKKGLAPNPYDSGERAP